MTENNAQQSINSRVEDYFAMWNETDAAKRQALIAAAWSEDSHYVDPLFAASGAEALDAMVAGVHEQFPGHRFRLTSAVDVHHDRAHWEWELVGPDGGVPVVGGMDFATIAPDGRLREVTGFFHQRADAA
ncbi:MAG: nuclear transport factor 2 family protein [Ktedonobacterales bacterium]